MMIWAQRLDHGCFDMDAFEGFEGFEAFFSENKTEQKALTFR